MKHLTNREQNYINGKISQYSDAFVRQNVVWTAEQLCAEFLSDFSKLDTSREFKDGIQIWSSEVADQWLLSKDGAALVLQRAQKTWEKHHKLAKKIAPIVERVRFGTWWNTDNFFDISYGLKLGFNFKTADEVATNDDIPWSILHVEKELANHGTNLKTVLTNLSTSYLEKKFVNYWLENYYPDKNSPALIPEVCGFRAKFYYYKFNDIIYASYADVPDSERLDIEDIKPVNFRFDFFVASPKNKKATLIELDGFEHHKDKNDKTKDSIKRNTAADLGIGLFVFDTPRIENNLSGCFADINDYLKY